MKKYNRKLGLILSVFLLISTILSAIVIPLPIAKAAPTYSWSTFTVAASGDDVEHLAKTGFSNFTTDGDNLWVHSNEYTTRAWLRFEGLGAITNAGGVIDQIILSMYSGDDVGEDYSEVPGGYVSVSCPMYNWNFELTEANILAADMNPVASFDGDYLSPSGAWYNKTISYNDPRDWYAWSSNFNDVFTLYVGGFMQYSPDYTYYRSFTSFDEGHPAKLYVKYHTGTGYQNVLDEFDLDNATYVQTWNNYNFWNISGTISENITIGPFNDGFEDNNIDTQVSSWAETWIVGGGLEATMTLTNEAVTVHSGNYSIKFRDPDAVYGCSMHLTRGDFNFTDMGNFTTSVWVYDNMNQAKARSITLKMGEAVINLGAGYLGVSASLNTDDFNLYHNDTIVDSDADIISGNTWFKIEIEMNGTAVTANLYNSTEDLISTLTYDGIDEDLNHIGFQITAGAQQIGNYFVDDFYISSNNSRTPPQTDFRVERTPYPIVDLPSGSDWHSTGSILRLANGTFYLYTRSHGEVSDVGDYIKLYESDDINGPWEFVANVIDTSGLGYASVELSDVMQLANGTFYMWYDVDPQAGPGELWQIFWAKSVDGVTWTDHQSVVEEVTEPKWNDVVLLANGTYLMVHNYIAGTSTYQRRLSSDGVTWGAKSAINDTTIRNLHMVIDSDNDIIGYGGISTAPNNIYKFSSSEGLNWVNEGLQANLTQVFITTGGGIGDKSTGIADVILNDDDDPFILLSLLHDDDDPNDGPTDQNVWKGALLYWAVSAGPTGIVVTDPDGTVITPDPFEDIEDAEDFVEEWDEEHGPILETQILNMDAPDWVFEGNTRYEFSVEYIDVNLTDIDQVGISFIDTINNNHTVWYDRDANTLSVTSPKDSISGWLHSLTQAGVAHTGINTTAIFHVMFNTPIPDSYDVSLYARIVEDSDSGWINATDWGGGTIFNIYNLGGLATLTKSGTAGRVTGGDVFEIYAADTRTRNIVPVQDFDVRYVPLQEGWQVLGVQIQEAGDEQALLEEVQGWKWWLSTRTENQTIHPTNRKPSGAGTNNLTYVSYPFGLKIKANPTTSNGLLAEKEFWRKITPSEDELVTVEVHAMTPHTTGTTGKILITDDGYVDDLNAHASLDSKQVVDLVFAGNGSMRLTNATAGYIYPATYTGMTWYNFTFIINCTAQSYDFYVDEVLNATGVDFRQKTAGADSVGYITFMDISMSGNFTEFYIDDVRAYTDFDADYGGVAEATMLFKHLQHWSMDFDFFVENGLVYAQGASGTPQRVDDDYSDYGYVELGWDVMINGTYVNDFLVARVNITDGHISGKNDWIKFNVTWYNQGVYVKNDLLYGLFEGYGLFPGSAKDTAGLHWDIWFNRANASTVIGARINTEFYGMSDKSVWWAVWSSNWKPMRTEVSESTIFIDLKDANGTVHSAKDVLFVRSKVKVLRNTLAQFSYKVLNIAGLDFLVARDTMSGIDTPPIRDTMVPDIVSGFFGSALGSIFSAALKRLGNTLAGFGMGFFTMSIDFIDNIFAALGYPALVSTIFGWMDSLFASVPTLLGYGITMIGNIFTLINVSAGNTLTQIAAIITIWAGMYSTIMDMLNGVLTPGFNLWRDMGISSFIQVAAILYPLWLLILASDKGMQALIDHLTGVLNIASFFLNFILNVGGFFMGLLTGLIGAIRG